MIKFPPKRILVPMDVSKPSLSALAAAKGLARRFGSALELVYVQDVAFNVPAIYPDGTVNAMPALDRLREDFRLWCAHRLKEAVRDFPAARVKVRTVRGQPALELADLARQTTADLVVMGTHGYAGLDRFLFGSVAEAVVRRATVPVLAVHQRTSPPKFSRILVPCNLTPYSAKTLAYALDFARGCSAKVEVLYVAPEGAGKKHALAELKEHVKAAAGSRGARLPLSVASGDPRRVILAAAKKGRFDLIVLSAHRRPFSSDFVIGSTVERVLRHSEVPVLSVPSVGSREFNEIQLYAGGVPAQRIRLPA